MTRIRLGAVRLLLSGLAPDERDAVLGDLLELQTPRGRALREVAGLLIRRQVALLASWRGLLTLCAAVVPFALLIGLLTRFSAEVSAISAFAYIDNWSPTVLDSPGGRRDFANVVLTQLAGFGTLCVWSWLMGFMIGSLSRMTAWVNAGAFAFVLIGEYVALPQYHYAGNEAAFESVAYSVILPLALRGWFVLGSAIWGIWDGARRMTLGAPATLAVVVVSATLTAMASRRIGFAARGGWWPVLSLWPSAVQMAVWLPLAYLVGAAVWHRRGPIVVPHP